MNTSRITHMIVGMLVFVLLGSTFMGGVNAAVEITEYPQFTTGDYFNYDLNASAMVASMKQQFGPNSDIKVEMSKASMKVTGAEKVTVNGKSYDCIVMTMTMDLKMNISGVYSGMHYNGDMHMVMSQKMWETKSDLKQVKTESVTYSYMNMTMNGKKMNQDTKEITETTYSNLVDQYKLPVKVGSKWNSHTTEYIHTISMNRTNGGQWKKQKEFNTTQNTTMYYEVLSEQKLTVKAGTFDVLKIRSNESDNSTYMDMYMTSSGILVKMEMHSGNTTQFSMELSSYNMANEESNGGSNNGGGTGGTAGGNGTANGTSEGNNSGGSSSENNGGNGGSTPSIGIIPVIVAVGLAAIAYRRYSRQ